MTIIDQLHQKAKEHVGVCLGLDTTPNVLPHYIADRDISMAEKFWLFNKAIIDATYAIVACYKVQIACYEALGLDGLECYRKTLSYIKEKNAIVIADVKRGDIASTASQYAKGHFTGDFEADFITVNTYMGLDAISPYFPYLKEHNKGLFALVKTSNPSSIDLQDMVLENGQKVYQKMASLVSNWGSEFVGKSGYSAIGAVVGLTYPQEFEAVQALMPNTFFLIPGYGAQGGTGKDIAKLFTKDICGVVNSSRGIIGAHKGKIEDNTFTIETVKAVKAMQEDIKQWL